MLCFLSLITRAKIFKQSGLITGFGILFIGQPLSNIPHNRSLLTTLWVGSLHFPLFFVCFFWVFFWPVYISQSDQRPRYPSNLSPSLMVPLLYSPPTFCLLSASGQNDGRSNTREKRVQNVRPSAHSISAWHRLLRDFSLSSNSQTLPHPISSCLVSSQDDGRNVRWKRVGNDLFFRVVSPFQFLLLQMEKEHLDSFVVLFVDGVQKAVTHFHVIRQKTLKKKGGMVRFRGSVREYVSSVRQVSSSR